MAAQGPGDVTRQRSSAYNCHAERRASGWAGAVPLSSSGGERARRYATLRCRQQRGPASVNGCGRWRALLPLAAPR